MRRPAKTRVVRKKPGRKTAGGAKRAAAADATLAARIVTAPYLVEAKAARARVAEWVTGLPGTQAKPLKALLAAHKTVDTLLQSLAESSPYLWELASGDPARLLRLLTADPDSHLAALLADTGRAVAATEDETQAMRWLRRMKAEAALLIALADIGGVWPVMRATRALTDLADTAVDAAVRFALAEAARDGRLTPKDKTRPQDGSGYIVLAMGKMGAYELNYSSDIDLIVFYDAAVPAVPEDAAPAALFVRITQRLVKLLQERNADGYVFRTDLRLRPDPASTAIAISTAAALSYYESVGQNWERAAMIKARACAGGRGDPQRSVALRMAQISRLRRRCRRLRHEAADQCLSRPRRDRGGRSQHQAWPWRHSRGRIFRADPAVDCGRTQSRLARPRYADHPRPAGAGSLDRRRRARRYESRLHFPAHGRAPAADDQ
jgi:glutamine synthetase adenylyltransferase